MAKKGKHRKHRAAGSRGHKSHTVTQSRVVTYKTNPTHRGHHKKHAGRRHYRRNPVGGSFWGNVLTGSIAFPVSALANDLAWGFMPLPATMKTGVMNGVGKLATAAGFGFLAKMMLKKNERLAEWIAAGMVGGVIYDFSKSYMQQNFPTLPLSGVGDYPALSFRESAATGGALPEGSGVPSFMAGYVDSSMSGYVTNE